MKYPDMYELSDEAEELFNEAYNYNFGLNGYKENKSKAISLYKQSFKAGDYMAYVFLGDLIGEFDFDKAFYYHENAMIRGEWVATNALAYNFLYGNGVKKNYKLAYYLFEYMEDFKGIDSCYYLGIMYRDGLYVDNDYKKAIYYFNRGINNDNANCYLALGGMYYKGNGVKKDYVKAFNMFNEGYKKDNAEAIYYLSICYKEGIGTKKDVKKAKKLYDELIKSGFSNYISEYNEMN